MLHLISTIKNKLHYTNSFLLIFIDNNKITKLPFPYFVIFGLYHSPYRAFSQFLPQNCSLEFVLYHKHSSLSISHSIDPTATTSCLPPPAITAAAVTSAVERHYQLTSKLFSKFRNLDCKISEFFQNWKKEKKIRLLSFYGSRGIEAAKKRKLMRGGVGTTVVEVSLEEWELGRRWWSLVERREVIRRRNLRRSRSWGERERDRRRGKEGRERESREEREKFFISEFFFLFSLFLLFIYFNFLFSEFHFILFLFYFHFHFLISIFQIFVLYAELSIFWIIYMHKIWFKVWHNIAQYILWAFWSLHTTNYL